MTGKGGDAGETGVRVLPFWHDVIRERKKESHMKLRKGLIVAIAVGVFVFL